MDPYAPIIDVEIFGKNNLLAMLKAESENIIHLPGRKFDFRVQFSENKDFNAFAYEVGDIAYTNISIATILQLQHHAFLLMDRNELFSCNEQKNVFTEDYYIENFEEPEICQFDSRYKQIVFYAGPDDIKRQKVAQLIAIFGMEFLLFHELGHHVGGHLKFLSDKIGLQKLFAQDNSDERLEASLYQMLETDADAISIASLLENINTKKEFYGEYFLCGNMALIPHCIMAGITIVFFLMDQEDSSYHIEETKYLPRDIRFELVCRIFFDKLQTDYKECSFGQGLKELMKTFMITNELLADLYRKKNPQKRILLQENETIRTYYNKDLLPLWRKIREQLKPYAVIKLPE